MDGTNSASADAVGKDPVTMNFDICELGITSLINLMGSGNKKDVCQASLCLCLQLCDDTKIIYVCPNNYTQIV